MGPRTRHTARCGIGAELSIVGSTDVAWSEGERADSSTRPSGPPHVVAVGAELRSRVMSDVVTYEFEGDVAVVRIDDGKANALSPDVVAALDEAVGLAETEARALMLIGRPGRFSAGFDLTHMQASVESAQSLVAAGARLAMRLYGLGIPTVAFSGHAVAMGALLLLACDTRLGAAGEFRIGLNEVAIGLGLPVFGVELARDRLDPRRFTEATVQAQLYDPDGAAEVGYFDRGDGGGAGSRRPCCVEPPGRAAQWRVPAHQGASPPGHDRSRAGDPGCRRRRGRVCAGRPDLNFRQGTHSAHHVARVSAVSTGPRGLYEVGVEAGGGVDQDPVAALERPERLDLSPGPEGPGTGRSRRTPGGGARRRLACPGSGRPRRARSRGRWRSDRPRGDRRGTPGRGRRNTCGAT